MKTKISKTKITADQQAFEKESRSALPSSKHADKARNFSQWSFIALVAIIAAFALATASHLAAAEPLSASQDALVTKQYAGSPELLASLRKASPANASAPLREVFESLGVPFPEGALAQVLPGGLLMIRNTKENLELVDALIEANSGKAGGSR